MQRELRTLRCPDQIDFSRENTSLALLAEAAAAASADGAGGIAGFGAGCKARPMTSLSRASTLLVFKMLIRFGSDFSLFDVESRRAVVVVVVTLVSATSLLTAAGGGGVFSDD